MDIDLGGGLRARVPTALSEADAVENVKRSSQLAALRAALAAVVDSGDSPDVDTRLADVAVAWNVFRHFYPYWSESGVDWDARLRPQLALAYEAATRTAHREVHSPPGGRCPGRPRVCFGHPQHRRASDAARSPRRD